MIVDADSKLLNLLHGKKNMIIAGGCGCAKQLQNGGCGCNLRKLNPEFSGGADAAPEFSGGVAPESSWSTNPYNLPNLLSTTMVSVPIAPKALVDTVSGFDNLCNGVCDQIANLQPMMTSSYVENLNQLNDLSSTLSQIQNNIEPLTTMLHNYSMQQCGQSFITETTTTIITKTIPISQPRAKKLNGENKGGKLPVNINMSIPNTDAFNASTSGLCDRISNEISPLLNEMINSQPITQALIMKAMNGLSNLSNQIEEVQQAVEPMAAFFADMITSPPAPMITDGEQLDSCRESLKTIANQVANLKQIPDLTHEEIFKHIENMIPLAYKTSNTTEYSFLKTLRGKPIIAYGSTASTEPPKKQP